MYGVQQVELLETLYRDETFIKLREVFVAYSLHFQM